MVRKSLVQPIGVDQRGMGTMGVAKGMVADWVLLSDACYVRQIRRFDRRCVLVGGGEVRRVKVITMDGFILILVSLVQQLLACTMAC